MNFLNDSLKTLKNVLAEGLEQKVDFEGSSSETGDADQQATSDTDKEKLKKLCQHQNEEVKISMFLLLRCSSCRVTAHDFYFPSTDFQFRGLYKSCAADDSSYDILMTMSQ